MKLKNQFWWLEEESRTFYYDNNKKMWVGKNEYTGNTYPATFPCGSFKSAKRHLRKHNELPKGIKFILVSQFVGMDRFLIKK